MAKEKITVPARVKVLIIQNQDGGIKIESRIDDVLFIVEKFNPKVVPSISMIEKKIKDILSLTDLQVDILGAEKYTH